jgi:hypothetical protein
LLVSLFVQPFASTQISLVLKEVDRLLSPSEKSDDGIKAGARGITPVIADHTQTPKISHAQPPGRRR